MQKTPPFDAQKLLDYLEHLHIAFQRYTHPAVFTVAEANHVSNTIPGAHCRNLFLRDKRETMFLVTLRDQTPVDLKKLATVLGAGRLSFGSPERLWTYLGVRPGSVTPLAILNDTDRRVHLILEAGMMTEPIINFHPLENTMTVGMTPSDLMTILEKHAITPQIIDLTPLGPNGGPDRGSNVAPVPIEITQG